MNWSSHVVEYATIVSDAGLIFILNLYSIWGFSTLFFQVVESSQWYGVLPTAPYS